MFKFDSNDSDFKTHTLISNHLPPKSCIITIKVFIQNKHPIVSYNVFFLSIMTVDTSYKRTSHT